MGTDICSNGPLDIDISLRNNIGNLGPIADIGHSRRRKELCKQFLFSYGAVTETLAYFWPLSVTVM